MNIYVGNLNYKVSENDLKGVFEEYGTVLREGIENMRKLVYAFYSWVRSSGT